jgi:hypothetical protein
MRKIVTAVTAAALSLSMLAAAVPALAVTGYDSAYAGESAFVNISPGQTLNFQVFFANTGTTTWSRGTGTQVDLAACLEDKTTCNAQDATEASWNSGWLSATRYSSTVQTTTAPGALGTFSYNIAAPANVTAGTYRFNGDLVLSSTGEKIHPEGYYQDATVGGGGSGATITSLVPNTGSTNGGNNVVISGSGFVCTPAFPSVSFGGTNASVTSCGATSVTAVAPAHATGSVTVTLTNSGATASNGLTYTFQDTTKPTFTAVAVAGNLVTVTFSEPVCRAAAWTNAGGPPGATGDWNINNISSGTPDIADSGDTIPICTAARDNGVTQGTIVMSATVTPGAFVEVTLNEKVAGAKTNTSFVDASNNPAAAPQARQANATSPETVPPTISSASGAVGSTTVVVNFSEPVYCTNVVPGDFILTDNDPATVDPTVTAVTGCGVSQVTADNSINLTTSTTLPAARAYSINYTSSGGAPVTTNEIQDIAGNDLANCTACTTFTTGAADFTPPTMIDARMSNNAGPSTDFVEAGDAFTVTFSEKMNGALNGTVSIQDQDGTTATITCSAVAGANQASCVWDTAVTTMTVTLTGVLATTGAGTTPGMQIPFNITALTNITDVAGNPPNVLGSSDRLVDYE